MYVLFLMIPLFVLIFLSILNFLNVKHELNNVGVDTCVWQKPTNTGLLLNFHAICPTTWKSGLIVLFLHQAECICPTLKLDKHEVSVIFQRNVYPNWFLDKVIIDFETPNIQEKFKIVRKWLFVCLRHIVCWCTISYFCKTIMDCTLIKDKFNVHLNICYKMTKVIMCFF